MTNLWLDFIGRHPQVRMTAEEKEDYRQKMALEKQAGELMDRPSVTGFGFWYSKYEPMLPMPVATDVVHTDVAAQLAELQQTARHVSYRGWSTCRVCGCHNGSREYVHQLPDGRIFKWPEGYLHYLTAHGVEPDAACLELLAGLTKENHET